MDPALFVFPFDFVFVIIKSFTRDFYTNVKFVSLKLLFNMFLLLLLLLLFCFVPFVTLYFYTTLNMKHLLTNMQYTFNDRIVILHFVGRWSLEASGIYLNRVFSIIPQWEAVMSYIWLSLPNKCAMDDSRGTKV